MPSQGSNSRKEVALTQLEVLRAIERLKDAGKETSVRVLCDSLCLSPFRLNSAIKRLESDGFLVVSTQWSENGGQLPNAYAVTQKGKQLLDESGRRVYELLKQIAAGGSH